MPKIFITGASGFVGSAVVPELLKHGYEVLGLARNDASAEKLTKAGVTSIRGDLHNLDSLKEGAKQSDGVIHLAFVHDFSSPEAMAKATATDRAAIQAMSEGLEGTGKPLIICSGTLSFPAGKLATEDTELETSHMDRDLSWGLLQKISKEKNIRGMVVRFAPTVHGKGDWGFITLLGNMAQKNGFVTLVGDGSSRWPAVHRLDAAVLLRLAFEKGKSGSNYNVIAEQGISQREIQGAIGKKLNLPVESKSAEEAGPLLGMFSMLTSRDNPTSGERTQNELGWKPTQLGLLEDIEKNYF